MNQKGLANIILVLVIIVVVGTVGYFTLTRRSTPVVKQTPISTPTTTQVPVTQQPTPATSIPDRKTATWKTYRNEVYGFDIKYPSEWKILNEGETSYGNISGFNVQFGISQAQIFFPLSNSYSRL